MIKQQKTSLSIAKMLTKPPNTHKKYGRLAHKYRCLIGPTIFVGKKPVCFYTQNLNIQLTFEYIKLVANFQALTMNVNFTFQQKQRKTRRVPETAIG
jgi:hypothetical protein